MREYPQGAELIGAVREVLKNDFLNGATSEQRYKLLMCFNALTIAEQQLKEGAEVLQQEVSALETLLATRVPFKNQDTLMALNRQLSKQIREKGKRCFDGQWSDAPSVYRHLVEINRTRLAQSNKNKPG